MLLELDQVQRHFGGVRAVDGVSGSLAEGRILGLIGPNGSGKTTLLSVISGALPPSGGRIRFDGTDTTGWTPLRAARMGIGRAFQITQAMPELSVVENAMVGAMFGTRRLRKDEAYREALSALEQVGLAGKERQSVEVLSLADRKALELARLLAMRPRLALVDEVMAGLSTDQVRATERILLGLRDEGVTLIVVEHVPGVIANVADEICVLHQGKVLRWGDPHAVLTDEAVVGAYLGHRGAVHA